MPTLEARDAPSALKWIIQNHYSKLPARRPHCVRIVTNKGTCTEEECASTENVVTVFEGRMTYWYRPYSEPGSPRFSGWQLTGLFDFLKAVVWQRAIDEWKVERFLAEQTLGDVEKAAVDRYKALQNEGKQIAQADIERALRGHPSLARLYATARTLDSKGLKEFVDKPDDEISRIGVDTIGNLIQAIKKRDEETSRTELTLLTWRIMQRALEGLPVKSQIKWQSAEYSQNVNDTNDQVKLLDELSTRWYADRFASLCLSDRILELGERFFFGKWEEDQHSFRLQVSRFTAQVLGPASSAA